MSNSLVLANIKAPGTYVSQNVGGALPVELAGFQTAYAIVSTPYSGWYSVGDANPLWAAIDSADALAKNNAKLAQIDARVPANTPIQVLSLADYEDVFCGGKIPSTEAALVSYRSVKLFFRNVVGGVLFATRTKPQPQIRFALDLAALGDLDQIPVDTVFSFTVNGTVVTYRVPVLQGAQATVDGIFTAITSNIYTSKSVYLVDDITSYAAGTTHVLASKNGSPISFVIGATALANGFITTVGVTQTVFTVAAGVQPTAQDYVATILNSFDTDIHQPGFLCAPEAFHTLPTKANRLSVFNAIEIQASDYRFGWLGVIDPGKKRVGAPTVGYDYVNDHEDALVEQRTLISPDGNTAYYAPNLIDLEEGIVPPSLGVIGVAISRYRNSGFQTPPAGAKYPVKGILGVQFKITRQEQEVSSQGGLNAIRLLPNLGVVVWGGRTLATNPQFRFVNGRVVINVLIATLRTAFDTEIFSVIDGQGLLFGRIKETANQVCYQLYAGNALYGATPDEAFLNVCDTTNNIAGDIESGGVQLDSYVATSPTLERLLISVTKLPIGGVRAQAVALGG